MSGRRTASATSLPTPGRPARRAAEARFGRVFCGFDGETPAGAGLLYVRDGVGWFSYAATLPTFRARGCQGAILARRIEAAREAGFVPLYNRENWIP